MREEFMSNVLRLKDDGCEHRVQRGRRTVAEFVRVGVLLFGLLGAVIAHSQTACLVYSFADQFTGCSATASSASAAVLGVFACDAPKFCGSSLDTLDSVDSDPATAGQSFAVTVTFTASPGCGSSATGSSSGGIASASGTQCPALAYFVLARPEPQSECRTCNGVSDPIDPAVGTVFKTEDDVVLRGPGGLAFQRFYNSARTQSSDLGAGWRHSYSRSVSILTNPPYVPYPTTDPGQSSLYPDPGTACASGFAQARSQVAAWQGSTAVWTGSACVIQRAGATLGTVRLHSTVQVSSTTNSVSEIGVIRDDGQLIRFPIINGVPSAPPGSSYQLQQTASGFTVTDPNDAVETYNTSGVLQSVTSRAGVSQTMGYDSLQRLSTITDSFGNALTLSYNGSSQLVGVSHSIAAQTSCLVYTYPYRNCTGISTTAAGAMSSVFACIAPSLCTGSSLSLDSVNSDPATAGQNFTVTVTYHAGPSCGASATAPSSGSISAGSGPQCGAPGVQYSYDSQRRLSTITNADATTQTYVYEDTALPNLLTGVIDESGNRFSTWGYDSQGRAVSSQEAGGANGSTLIYNSPTSVTETDALGAVRTFSYQRVGDLNLPISISGSKCSTCEESAATSYDTAGFVSSRTDYNGNLTCYANDPIRGLELVRVEGFAPGSTCPTNLSTYTPAAGSLQRKITTQWSTSFRVPVLVTEATRTTSFDYDASGNLVTNSVTDTTVSPNASRTWAYTYNGYGQVLTIDGPRTDVSDVTTISYYTCATGVQCGQINTITNALGQVTTFLSYNGNGQPLTIRDPNGVVTTLTYDARQHLTSSQVGTETTSYSYYPTGLVQTVILPDSSALQYTYDGAHRLTGIADGAGNSIKYTLDALGNHIAETASDPAGTLHRAHTRVYNVLDELYQDINAAGTAAVTTTFNYDDNGNQSSIAAPLSRNTSKQYDALNRLTQITDPVNGVTQLAYDANDKLTSLTDPRSLQTTYTHNGFGEVTRQVSPDTGTTNKAYDSAGNLKSATDARGAVATYSYDALNRVTQAAYGDQTINFTYDAGTHGVGRLTGALDANHSLAWTYDTQGHVVGKGLTLGSVALSVGYAYGNGDLTSIVTPSGQTITYGYTNHQITSISVNGSTLLSSVTYEPFGGVHGWSWSNATTVSRVYDTDGKITQIGTAGDTVNFGYDNAFRITGIADTGISANSWTLGYDNLNRLTSAATAATSLGWTYDANGNRLSQTGSSASTSTSSSTSNQLSSTSGALSRTYSNDAAGNTTSYASDSFSYNQRGRMTSATVNGTTTSYIYSALGQMVEKSGASGTTFLMYDEAGHVLGEYSSTGALVQETVWMGDTPVATLRPSGTGVSVYYVHTDQLNAPRVVTRPSDNAIAWRWDTDPFGTTTPNQNPQSLGTFIYNLRFPGMYYLPESGLFYNFFRTFDPATGRYLESDRLGLFGGSLSTYSYANNNPISNIDPFGLWSFTVGGYLGAGAEVTIGSDDGHGFITARVGFGIGGGASFDPHGGLPGGTDATGCRGGSVISASVRADAGFGPLGGQFEGGVDRNLTSQIIGGFTDKGGALSAEHEGARVAISGGVQVTLYRALH
jgi:RHS repeat-associated protein